MSAKGIKLRRYNLSGNLVLEVPVSRMKRGENLNNDGADCYEIRCDVEPQSRDRIVSPSVSCVIDYVVCRDHPNFIVGVVASVF